jgi:hypothetical protein
LLAERCVENQTIKKQPKKEKKRGKKENKKGKIRKKEKAVTQGRWEEQ